ncbi:MAG: sigma-54 dependent transcriptional regulator [Vicinamibacterales bacterium]|jgi:two-component system response regulator PilR (NtrC family)|nr:sigma-54 dependent transcriptional regulator [Vicinamibacterales bacterium]
MSALPDDLATAPWAPRRPQPARETVPSARILIADDERSMRELLSIVLKREGYEVVVAESGSQAVAALERHGFDLVISDLKMPDMSGVDVLRAAKQVDPELSAIVITAFASTETAVEALRLGASDYLTKPFDVDELKLLVRHTLERKLLRQENVLLKRALGEAHQFSNIVGASPRMLAVFRLIETVARTTSTVLVTGESGTGKELVARAVHFNSLRRDRPFVAVNCGALPETLLESELFGHMRGAFTGAAANRKGLIEAAQQGTVFLDEISEMSPLMQVKLLRVLQERRFRRLGGTEEIEADIRIIAATNRDLQKEIAEGRFREDLFYRINVIQVELPPLRERAEDVRLLAEHFVTRLAQQMGKNVTGISREALDCLERYAWPGNVRELENAMERAVALEQSPTVLPDSLPDRVRFGEHPPAAALSAPAPVLPALPESGFSLEAHVAAIERAHLAAALQRANGVRTKAAELLGMTFRSFRYYAKKYDV